MTNDNNPNDLGPIEPLLADPDISEIMINGPDSVFIEKHGKLIEVDNHFESEDHLMDIIERIVTPLGRVVNESYPIVDVRLEDGSRVNIVIRPIALNGPTVTIRKFITRPLSAEDVIRYGSMSTDMMAFLKACVESLLNIVVAGGTGSGKTTICNILANFINNEARIVVVENYTELILNQRHVVKLEARPANLEGKGEITAQVLVQNAMKMRPERILLGEARGGEVLDLFQAINTGHDGSLFTIHANNARDTLSRLEVMAMMAGVDMPLLTVREQMAKALNIVVNQQRLRDGTRKVMTISEVTGMQGTEIAIQPIFEFVETGMEDGRVTGYFTPTGYVPAAAKRIADFGTTFPDDFFTPVR